MSSHGSVCVGVGEPLALLLGLEVAYQFTGEVTDAKLVVVDHELDFVEFIQGESQGSSDVADVLTTGRVYSGTGEVVISTEVMECGDGVVV